MLPLQFTINSDDEVEPESDKEVLDEAPQQKKKFRKTDMDIDFDTGEFFVAKRKSVERPKLQQMEPTRLKDAKDSVKEMSALTQRVALTQKKSLKAKKRSAADEDDDVPEQSTPAGEDQGVTAEEEEQAYFDRVVHATGAESEQLMFSQLGLSRPLLRAVESLGYVQPTPIQAQVIPFALQGRDICASAATGSGKTAAFMLPCLERLMFRPKDVHAIRVLVLTPTRELATQIHSVTQGLSNFMSDVRSVLICGGRKDVRAQEATLRSAPEIVIATPGRMLDHLRNGLGISVELLDILILDEADRLLELGFTEEVSEVVRYCPATRQTMLFSATMTANVQELMSLSLRKPIRIKADSLRAATVSKQDMMDPLAGSSAPDADETTDQQLARQITQIPERLTQEFLKVNAHSSVSEVHGEQEALVLSLLGHSDVTQRAKTIVFCERKVQAKRLTDVINAVFNTNHRAPAEDENNDEKDSDAPHQAKSKKGAVSASSEPVLWAVALHGDLSQAERFSALKAFVTQSVPILVATDVAARGLDLPLVDTVINAELPRQLATYVHRIGRTARAGRTGRAISLVTEDRRKVLKDILKAEALRQSTKATTSDDKTSARLLSRKVHPSVIQHYRSTIVRLEPKLVELRESHHQRLQLQQAEAALLKAENLVTYADEIQQRAPRSWFRSKAETEALRATTTARALGKQVKTEESNENHDDNGSDDEEEQKPVHPATLARQRLEQVLSQGRLRDSDQDLKKQRKLKASADGNDDSNALSKHRLSRRKRRRQLALQSEREDREAAEPEGQASKRAKTGDGSKKKPKEESKSLSEQSMRKVKVYDNEKGEGQVRHGVWKVVRPAVAVGGLDSSISDWFGEGGGAGGGKKAQRVQQARLKKETEFTEFDPNKRLRKGGKIGKAAFKSKKRFKRR